MKVHAHKLIAETAEAMASAVFEEAMGRDNELYRQIKAKNPDKSPDELRRIFVRYLAPRLAGDARATLAGMLQTSSDEELKAQIFDALLKDAALRRGRNRAERRLIEKLKH